ncbi:MAG: Ig-like domain repeat protein [Anaerolineales bacterium]|nr:Ig-like domain repeat protein [Anaerolineales bacterium]
MPHQAFSANLAEDAGSTATDNANLYGVVAMQPALVVAAAGNNQTAVVNTVFATQLQVLMTAGGAPVAGMPVTFAVVPGATGASATFPGSQTSVKRYTDSTGRVTAPVLTANGVVGEFNVTANAGLADSARFKLTNVAGAPAHVIATGGAPQHVRINTAFEARLQARVVDVNNLPVVNAKVTFSAPATGPSATFPSGGATGVAQTNDNGVATAPVLTANALGGGYFVTAMVDGVGAPAVFSLTNDKASGSIALASAPNPSGVGIPIALEATVQTKLGVVPTGAVTFLDGSVTLGSSILDKGVAKLTVPELAIGAHVLTAAYSGDASFTNAQSAPITHTVLKRNTQAKLEAAPNPSYIGHVVYFTATVTSPKGIPDGVVVFQDGDVTLATDTLNNGVATFATSAMALGTHPLTARYQGTET